MTTTSLQHSTQKASSNTKLPSLLRVLLLLNALKNDQMIFTSGYSIGYLQNKDIAGIWRLTSKHSFLPSLSTATASTTSTSTTNPNANNLQQRKYPMKEFTVYPKKKQTMESGIHGNSNSGGDSRNSVEEDILLLLKEDGKFVQYTSSSSSSSSSNDRPSPSSQRQQSNTIAQNTYAVNEMKGSWALVDGKLILAADRRKDIQNIRSDGHDHDTILEGRIVAVSTTTGTNSHSHSTSTHTIVDENITSKNERKEKDLKDESKLKQSNTKNSNLKKGSSSSSNNNNNIEDVHLSVPKGKVKIGKFFYPQNHPSFFEQPIYHPTSTGSFELRQVLGHLNTQISNDDDQLIEKFRKKDLMNKRYFITSYPLPVSKKKRKRWSIKYNKFVDAKPKSPEQKEWEERQKNAPIPIKAFEVDLFANNTFQTATGLGDKILRGKWSIIGDKRDQLWMKVWRFGFGRAVSGSTYSEGASLSNKDDVAYWGKIYQVDAESESVKGRSGAGDDNDDDEKEETTKIEINGSVMYGVGIEPCSVARFTMIEKSEDDFYDDDDLDDEDDLDDDDCDLDDDDEEGKGFFEQFDDLGSFE